MLNNRQHNSIADSISPLLNRRLSDFLVIAFWCMAILAVTPNNAYATGTSAPDSSGSAANTKLQKHINAANQRAANNQQKTSREQTAAAINKVPGVHVAPKDLAIPEENEITGFHPIKRLIEPVVRLEKNTIQLQQQIMKLEGPIAGLQKPMLGLHDKMGSVETKMEEIKHQLMDMQQEVAGVRHQLEQTDTRVAALQDPILGIQKPLTNVAGPLSEVRQELAKVETLIASVLLAIVLAAVAIAVGTPVAAIMIYRNRKKLFPGLGDHDFPVAKTGEE